MERTRDVISLFFDVTIFSFSDHMGLLFWQSVFIDPLTRFARNHGANVPGVDCHSVEFAQQSHPRAGLERESA
jgi:hypothetical protein